MLFHSASETNLGNGGNTSGQPSSDSQPAQSLVQLGPQQATLPAQTPSRSRRFFRRLGFSSSPPPSLPPQIAPHNVATAHHTATPAPLPPVSATLGSTPAEIDVEAAKLPGAIEPPHPFIDEVNAKEGVIRECADAATMERVRSKCNSTIRLQFSCMW